MGRGGIYERDSGILVWGCIIVVAILYFGKETFSPSAVPRGKMNKEEQTTETTAIDPTKEEEEATKEKEGEQKPAARVEEAKKEQKSSEGEQKQVKQKAKKYSKRASYFLCSMYPEFLQICSYTNLCYDGKQVVLLDPTISEPKAFAHKDPQLDSVNWEPLPVPPQAPHKEIPIPHDFKGTGYYLPSSWVDWDNVADSSKPVASGKVQLHFVEGSMYLVYPETPHTSHPWHTLLSLMPLWSIQYFNQTRLPEDPIYPAIDNLFLIESNEKKNALNYFMLKLITQSHTQVRFQQDILVSGVPLVHAPAREKYVNFRPNRGTPIDLPDTEKHLICARRGVIPAYKYNIFSGPAEAFAFRQKVYSFLNIAWDPNSRVPNFVLVVDRVGSRRTFNNPQQILDILTRLGLPYKYLHNPAELPVEEQVKLFFEAGLSIHPHGGGLTNIMFQRPKTAAIEVFNYHHHQHAFAQLAMNCRILHFPVYTYVKGPSVRFESDETEQKCANSTIYEIGKRTECLWPSLYSKVDFPSTILELTIISAMRAIGYPILPSPAIHAWLTAETANEFTEVEPRH